MKIRFKWFVIALLFLFLFVGAVKSLFAFSCGPDGSMQCELLNICCVLCSGTNPGYAAPDFCNCGGVPIYPPDVLVCIGWRVDVPDAPPVSCGCQLTFDPPPPSSCVSCNSPFVSYDCFNCVCGLNISACAPLQHVDGLPCACVDNIPPSGYSLVVAGVRCYDASEICFEGMKPPCPSVLPIVVTARINEGSMQVYVYESSLYDSAWTSNPENPVYDLSWLESHGWRQIFSRAVHDYDASVTFEIYVDPEKMLQVFAIDFEDKQHVVYQSIQLTPSYSSGFYKSVDSGVVDDFKGDLSEGYAFAVYACPAWDRDCEWL